MTKGRLEAFSDGVIAIIITIMVLELKVPHGADLAALKGLVPVFFSYVLSFIFVGLYWNNHHHLLQVVKYVNGSILWANLHLLFWLSLIPFTTAWLGENHMAPWPVVLYGIDLIGAAIAYYILTHILMSYHAKDSALNKAMGADVKGKISVLLYALAIPAAFINTFISIIFYTAVAVMWLVPDKRIERALEEK